MRIRALLGAQRATVYLVDRKHGLLHAKIAHHTGPGRLEIQMPIGTGIAGKVAETGKTVNLVDAHTHPDFNAVFDMANPRRAEQGLTNEVFLTKSMLCMPIFDRRGEVIGVAQVLNKVDGQAFSPNDERQLRDFSGSLGIILETCNQIASAREVFDVSVPGQST